MNEQNNNTSRRQYPERMQRYQSDRRYIEAERLRRKKKRRRQLRIRRSIAAGVALTILILIIVLITKGCSGGKKEIIGIWRLDNSTTYQFEKDGTGAMLLSNSQYEYTFKVKGENLHIDYQDDILVDGSYKFTVEGDTLILSGGEGTSGDTYELVRIDND